jgi:hypothetical protein
MMLCNPHLAVAFGGGFLFSCLESLSLIQLLSCQTHLRQLLLLDLAHIYFPLDYFLSTLKLITILLQLMELIL